MAVGPSRGDARGFGTGLLPRRAVPAWPRRFARATRRTGPLPTLLALYLLAVVVILSSAPFGSHPPWAYNWEGYAAWRWESFWSAPDGPSLQILASTDALMTDSGQGPLIGLPMALGVALFGFELRALRIPTELLAALSVPLLWLFGRRVVGTGPAMLAALLLAVSPAFLFYGRTATLVGASLVPLLLSALALARVLEPGLPDRWRWRREGALAAAMLLGIYAYAPIRLFWPLALAALALAAWRNQVRRGILLRCLLLSLLIVPVAVMALEWLTAPEPAPVAAVSGYFHVRGEQLVAMGDTPSEAGQYVRDARAASASGWEAPLRLIAQNTADLARLLIDRDTLPVPTDYWNERGRFWPWFLLPFAVIGLLIGVVKGLRGGEDALVLALPLLLAAALALPLLLTSRVHIGRLLPALPFALLLVGTGVWACASGLAAIASRAGFDEWASARWVAPLLAGTLLLPAVAVARADMAVPLSPTREARTVAVLAEWQSESRERGGAILVEDPNLGDDIERVHAATYRLDLDDAYRFVDLQSDQSGAPGDPRPALFWRGALPALQAGAIASPCDRLWFVGPEITDKFLEAWRDAGCTGAPDSVVLP